MHEWVEQQRVGASEARAISAEAANRDLEARLSRGKKDRRDAESRLADVTKEREQFDRHVGHTPPTLRNFLQNCFFFFGVCYAP